MPPYCEKHGRYFEYSDDGVLSCPTCLGVEPSEPTDDEIYNRPGVEGGIGYTMGGDW